MPIPGGGMAGGGIIVIIGIIAAILLGGNVLGSGGGGLGGSLDDIGASAPAPGSGDVPDPDLELKQFVSAVLDDVQQYWAQQFSAGGKRYEDAQLVLFNRPIDTGGCGVAASSSGPFYCPADQAVYLDLGFFRELRTRFGAPGDFAQAYVLAHELGHHVQNLLGIDVAGAPAAGGRSVAPQRSVGAPRAAGRLPRRRVGDTRPTIAASSSRATSTRDSQLPPRSATTASAPAARRSGRTAPLRSA